MKPSITILLLSLTLLLASCISIEVHQQVYEDGSSHVKITQDFSGLLTMAESMGGMMNSNESLNTSGMEDQLQEYCVNASQDPNLENFECRVDGMIVVLEGDLSANEDVFSSTKGVFGSTYTYEVRNALSSLDQGGNLSDDPLDFSDESLTQGKQMADAMGMEYTYVVTMPAPIVSADLGLIDGDTVTINMFDLVGYEQVYITAESSSNTLIFIIIAVMLVLAVIIFFLLRKKKSAVAVKQELPVQENVSTNQSSDSLSSNDAQVQGQNPGQNQMQDSVQGQNQGPRW